jgi:hypothetical protein
VIGEFDGFTGVRTPADLFVDTFGSDRFDRAGLATATSEFEKRVNSGLAEHHVRFGFRTFWALDGAGEDAPDAIREVLAGIDLHRLAVAASA